VHVRLACLRAVDEVLAAARHKDLGVRVSVRQKPAGWRSEEYLAGDGDLRVVHVPMRARGAVRVVEDDGDRRLGDTSLAALVDEVLLVLRAHLRAAGSARAVRRQEDAERQSEGGRRRKRVESTYVCHVREAEHEAYRVENVALPRAV
jgi:hypothetical protein